MSSNYLRTARERRQSIIDDNNPNDRFYFEHQTVGDVDAFRNGVFLHSPSGRSFFGGGLVVFPQLNRSGAATVGAYDDIIMRAASEFGIDADIVRAVIYTEVSRGVSYGQITEAIADFSPLEATVLPGNIHPDWEVLIPGSDVNNVNDNIRLTAKILSEISDRLDAPYPEDIYALYNSLSHDRTYVNGDTKNTPYFMKRVFEEKAWEKSWELTPNGDLEFYTSARDSKFLLDIERQQILAGNLRPNTRDFAGFLPQNIRDLAFQQYEAGTIDPLLIFSPAFNTNRGGGVWSEIASRVAQIDAPWDQITIAYSADGLGGSFGLAVNYSDGSQRTLSTLVVEEMNADETFLYTHNTVSLTSTLEGVNISIKRPDESIAAEVNIRHNDDGSVDRAEINNYISEEFSVSADLFSEDGGGKLNISAPEINVRPSFDSLSNEQQLASLNGQIGGILASSAGRLLTDQIGGVGGTVSGIVVSELLTDAGAAFGAALNESGDLLDNFSSNLDTALESFGVDVAAAGVGVVSSLLTAEVADALGLDGLAAEVFGLNYNSVVSAAVARGVEPFLSLISENLANSLVDATNLSNLNPANLIGGFIGAKLGSLVVSPRTQAGAILSSVGSAVGGLIGGVKIGSSIGSFVVPGIGTAIGAFVGFVLGGLIGNLFGKKKPKVPMADASTVLSFQDGYYYLGAVNSANNGNEDLVTDMANSAADTLNAFIDVAKGDDENAHNINTVSPTQIYGHSGNDLYVRVGGVKHSVDTANEAVEIGALAAIKETKIAGGNLLIKRAVLRSEAEDLATFGGDLQVAEDYATYLRNQDVINELITVSDGNEISTYAAGWVITLQRAAELGLNQSAASDFYGGAKGFIDSLQGVLSAPVNYEDIAFRLDGKDLEVVRDANQDGVAQSSEDILFDETNFLEAISHADGGVGYHEATSNATMTNGNDVIIGASGTIDDLTSQSVSTTTYVPVYGDGFGRAPTSYRPVTTTTTQTIEGGDDIIIGNAGSNTLYGRSGNDWLDGGAGIVRDNLHGGDGDDVLLGRGGKDYLYGDAGDDILIAGEDNQGDGVNGRDYLHGGSGNDTLVMFGRGTALGGTGDDLLIAWQNETRGFAGVYRGDTNVQDTGNDTISFERYNQGITLNMANRPASWDSHSAYLYRHESTRQYDVRSNDGNNTRLSYLFATQIDNVTGTQFGDVITGDDGANVLRGLGGDDVIYSGSHGTNNALFDIIEGGAGADRIVRTNNSNITVSYEHSSAGVDVSIQSVAALGGQHAFGGDASGDVFEGHITNLTGSAWADVLEGNHGSNRLYGLDGDDYFIATRGSDQFWGGEGFDTVDYGNHTGSSGLSINAINGQRTYGYLNGVHGASGYSRSWDVEHVVGTQHADTIRFGAGDNVLEGGAGNDTLYGGAGNDTYFVELGGGSDRIYEYGNQGHDTIVVGYDEGLSWDNVWIGAGANLSVNVNGQVLATAYNSPNDNRELVGVDAIDIGGVGAIDVWYVNYGASRRLASGGGQLIYGDHPNGSARRNLLQGSQGNDSIYAAGSASAHETENNILHGRRGNDRIYASVGDDQYIFDRGSGRDTVTDRGGLDHIQFGPGVQLEELVFTVIGNDLYIGIAAEGTTDTSGLNANQMTDYMRIVGGGVQEATHSGSAHRNLIEYITVQNVNVDIRTLDLDWTVVDGTNTGGGGGGGGGGGQPYIPGNGGGLPNIPPIMFDLDGDGLELISIDESRIVVRNDDRTLTRVGWLGADDGFLALDRNGDGKITSLSEISFTQDLEGAETDLEGLRAFDTNEDGVFDASDERFGEFRIWQDRNQNGRGGRRELMTLEEAGITAISLDGTSTGNNVNDFADSVILNTTEVTLADGTISTGYDVALASTVIREGRESALSTVGQSDGVLEGRLGRISVRRLEALLARQERLAARALDTSVKPIVIDLNGDGELALAHLSESGVQLDVDGNGEVDRVGWVGAEDGFLALDRNGNGLIEAFDEISFVQDLEGALTDLEGLKAFDTNEDGVFNSDDARFSEFVVWQDLNQDGLSDTSEVRSLADWGITSLNLTAHTGQTSFGGELENELFGLTAVGYADGTEGVAGDVGLRVQYAGLTDSETGEDAFITGFAGLEHVHVDSAAAMASITLDTDWGKIAGGRSPLMARLYAAEAEQARLDALGTDTGLTQDELLADFDSDEDGEGETDAESAESSADAGSVTTTDTEADVLDTAEFVREDQVTRVGYELEPHIVYGGRIGDIVSRQTLASTLEQVAVASDEAAPAEASLVELDRFTQAMAGFGAQTAFAGLNVEQSDEQRYAKLIGTQARSSLMTQIA